MLQGLINISSNVFGNYLSKKSQELESSAEAQTAASGIKHATDMQNMITSVKTAMNYKKMPYLAAQTASAEAARMVGQ